MDDDVRPLVFELALWGTRVHRAAAALARAALPAGVVVRSGSLGVTLTLPLTVATEAVEALVGRLDRCRMEGDVFFGLLPDRPLDAKRLLAEWTSAKRTAHVPFELTRAPPSFGDSMGDSSDLLMNLAYALESALD